MRRKSLGRAVGASKYPGRGIIVGKTADGTRAFFAYFIMGRSANSRNRIFTESGGEVKTEPFDASKVEDPSLILYSPVKTAGRDIIVANGDQTDTIAQSLAAGHCFRHALMRCTFEPDAPNYTPRISAILHLGKRAADYSYEMSILKCAGGRGKKCNRYFYCYEPASGTGHYLHTYQGEGRPLPSFAGEPEPVKIANGLRAMAEEIWENLNGDNKISLYCRAVNLKTGEAESVLFNKYTK